MNERYKANFSWILYLLKSTDTSSTCICMQGFGEESSHVLFSVGCRLFWIAHYENVPIIRSDFLA